MPTLLFLDSCREGRRNIGCLGASSGSDVEVVLHSLEADIVILAGIAASGGVLSAVTLAADLDRRTTTWGNGCTGADAEVHCVPTENVFRRQAAIRSLPDWIDSPAH